MLAQETQARGRSQRRPRGIEPAFALGPRAMRPMTLSRVVAPVLHHLRHMLEPSAQCHFREER
jgi:hypothetical protein